MKEMLMTRKYKNTMQSYYFASLPRCHFATIKAYRLAALRACRSGRITSLLGLVGTLYATSLLILVPAL